MEAIEECGVNHGLGEGREEMGSFDHGFNTLVDIANENHRRRCTNFSFAACKGARRHVVFHDLDAIIIVKANSRHFIESDDIIQAH